MDNFSKEVFMLCIAHRGASGDFKENTLSAIKRSLELGVDVIELDVQLTKTGELVLYHDPEIDNKWISELSMDELQSLNPDILLLEIALDEIVNTNTRVYLDLKTHYRVEERYFKQFCEALSKYVQYRSQIILGSFDHVLVSDLQSVFPEFSYGLILYGKHLEPYIGLISQKGISVLIINYLYLNSKWLELIKGLGLETWVYTINEKTTLDDYIKRFPVEGIITDFPNLLFKTNN